MPNKLLCLAAAVSLSACSYFSAPSQTGFQTAANTAPQQLDELMSAQAAFRQALSAQNSGDSVIINLQNKLADAQKRKLEAEADIQRLSAELTAANQGRTDYANQLKAAGDRLDAAWRASRSQ